ncbi:MAG: tRNA 2-thiocytidine biosynthesis protein TtcA [Tenericutes bacterium]|nr:tRNA 2-thiocytidine biosynthesis protein TtcA [Mycoplasmatota bacterium]
MNDNKYAVTISKSLNKRFKSPLLAKFLKGIDEYKLIQKGDKICVALSGGKDSLLLAALFEEYKLHFNNNIEVVYLTMNSGFTDEFLQNHISNCEKIGINTEVFDSEIYEIANTLDPKSPCFLCARMRRGFLYQKAKDLGCNKLALGHHFDDVIETTLMNIFYSGTFKTMLPKARSKNFEGLELIRPMYLIKEREVLNFIKYHNINFVSKGCEFQNRNDDSKRKEMKTMITELRGVYENIDINIFRSAQNINLDSVLGYFNKEGKISFLDEY